MKQASFFDLSERQNKLLKTQNFLDRVNRFVAWEKFRPLLDKSLKRPERLHGGRPPFDCVLMFKILTLQALYNLSDEQTEYQILDRQSFMMFLNLSLQDAVPDARTLWVFRETLRKAGAVEKLFAKFDAMLNAHGFEASGGQMVDATFVETPRQHNSHKDNDAIKQNKTPEDWSEKKLAHKDVDARWTKKNEVSVYGYKNHTNADVKHKIIRRYKVTDASLHDSQELESVLLPPKTLKKVFADSAYRSVEQEKRLRDKGYSSHIHERAYRNRPLTEKQKATNTVRSKTRVRIEHIFGHITHSMNGCFVRTIGIARAEAKIGMENLAYNISRFTFLMGAKAAAT